MNYLINKNIYRGYLLIQLFVIVLTTCCPAQTFIQGNIKDSSRSVIPNATVAIINSDHLILTYAIANRMGHYMLTIPSSVKTDSLFIQVTAIGYKSAEKKINNLQTDFFLSPEPGLLKNIIIKSDRPRLEVSHDTLSYDVASFSSQQDHAIIDVIKRLPGIEVDVRGKISYNGRAISNLYIDGDNLLDDKYNLATNSLPSSSVNKVQILENDQPIKILRNISTSDKVAINLSLKDSARIKLFGQANAGAGINRTYEEDITGMIFKKKIKFINSLKLNNSGIDLQDEIVSHNQQDYLKKTERNSIDPLLYINANTIPELAKQRFLFNQPFLINTNNLLNLKHEVQLRTNVYYLTDNERSKYQNDTKYFLGNDTVHFTEDQNLQIRTNTFYSQVNLNINKNKYYFKENLAFTYVNKSDGSNLKTNGNFINQSLRGHSNEFSNEVDFIKVLNNINIFEAYSFINYLNRPQILNVEPGVYTFLLNNNQPYSGLNQNVAFPTFYTTNYISLTKPHNNFTQIYKVGVITQFQSLQSSLDVRQFNGQDNFLPDSFQNNLNFNRYKLFGQADYNFTGKDEKLKIKLSLPFGIQKLSYSDNIQSLLQKKFIPFFSPDLTIKYQYNYENYFTARLNSEKNISRIENVYQGYILNNYRNLKNNKISIDDDNQRTSIIAGYTNTKNIKLRFFNFTAIYSRTKLKTLLSDTINNNVAISSRVPFPNVIERFQAISGYGKYFFRLHSAFKLNASVSVNNQDLFQNNEILHIKNYTYYLDEDLNSRISKKINSNYFFSFGYMNSVSMDSVKGKRSIGQQNFNLQQRFELNYSPVDVINIKVSGEHYYNKLGKTNSNNYFFMDAFFQWRLPAIQSEINLECLNIFNVQNFISSTVLANSLIQNIYSIRPRMIMVKFSFNF